MSGIPMLDGNEGSRRRAQCHGLPASLLAHIERKTEEGDACLRCELTHRARD
jgi:hypothetical protein